MNRSGRSWVVVLVAIGLVMVAPGALGQVQVVEDWRRTVPQTNGVMMDLDAANNVLVVGENITTLVTRKYDPDGALLWERSNPPAPQRARASWVSVDPAGNAIVTGHRIVGTSSPAGWVVVKYDPQGNVVWQDIAPSTLGQTVRVETDAAGNAYVTGSMFLGTSVDTVTTKYAPNGTKVWTRTFNGGVSAEDRPSSIAVSADGARIAVVGRSSTVFFTVIYDAQGNEVRRSVRTDLGTARDAAFGPLNVLYVGTSRWTPATSNQMTIVKFDAAGNTLFTRSYADGDWVYRVAVDPQGNVVAAGADSVYLDWVTLKIAADGTRQWSRLYSATTGNDEFPRFLSLDPAGVIYLTGQGGPIPPGPGISLLMMTTIRYEPDGTLAWVVNDIIARGLSVRVGTDDSVAVLGEGEMITVRYLQSDGGVPGGPPTAPTSLAVTSTTSSQVGLSWVNATMPQTSVRVERCAGRRCTNFVQVAELTGSAASFLDGGLSPGAVYQYRVRAVNAQGVSGYSNVVSARTRR